MCKVVRRWHFGPHRKTAKILQCSQKTNKKKTYMYAHFQNSYVPVIMSENQMRLFGKSSVSSARLLAF